MAKNNWIEFPTGEKVAIDNSIPLEIYSPFLDRENKTLSNGKNINPQGNISPSFQFVSNGYMQKLLDHIDKPTLKNRKREIKGIKLFSDGIMIDKGSLFVDEIESDLNNGSSLFSLSMILGDSDEYLELIRDKKLSDLNMGGPISIPGGDLAPGAHIPFAGSWGNIFAAPYPPIGSDPSLFELNAGFIAKSAVGLMPIPGTILRADIFADRGYENHAATAKFATDVVNNGHDLICFPTVIAYNDSTDAGYQNINYWHPEDERFNTYLSALHTDPSIPGESCTIYRKLDNPIVPMFYWLPVLRAIFSEFGYTLKDDWLFEDTQFKKLYFLNTYSVIKPTMIFCVNIFNHDGVDFDVCYYEEDTTIEAKNHLPQESITDFMADFCLKFNCYFDVKGKDVTIIHNELDKAPQGEFKDTGSKRKIRLPKTTGLKLQYDLTDDSYKKEALLTKPYTSLPDETAEADLPDGDLYLVRDYNVIYEKQSTAENPRIANNIIPYNSGNSKEYTMKFTPINCAVTNYLLLYRPDLLNPPLNVFLPFINSNVIEREVREYTYQFDHATPYPDTPSPGHWVLLEAYMFLDVNEPDDVTPQSTSMVGFYHGLLEIMDLTGTGFKYPYASNHNYKPFGGKIGDWHLGILGDEGLQKTFWKKFVNIFNNNRQIIISSKKSVYDIKKHLWNRSMLYRGTELYVSCIRPNLPIREWPVFECYEL